MAIPDTALVKKRAWLVYPVLAAAATTVYYLLGQNSLLFNLIGLTSPILIIVAVKIHAPEKRWPWYLIAIGQFLFIAGDVVSYNYVLFHDVFPQLFPLDFAFNPTGDVPFPGPADALYLAVYPCLITGLLLMIHARNPGRGGAARPAGPRGHRQLRHADGRHGRAGERGWRLLRRAHRTRSSAP